MGNRLAARATTPLMRLSCSVLALAAAAAAAALAGGCSTKSNDAVCCTSESDCARLGVDEPRPCGAGQACRAFECVAAECATAADCDDPAAPACAAGLCVAACTAEADCAGAASGELCAPDGACVGCLSEADCTADAPFCDADARSCRGCIADSECASGVCIEADGVCAAEADVVYLGNIGFDVGSCTRSAPCRTLSYALQQATTTRHVIRIAQSEVISAAPVAIGRPVILDGVDTVMVKPLNKPLFELSLSTGVVTLEGVVVRDRMGLGDPTVVVPANTTLRIVRATLEGTVVSVARGTVDLRDATVKDTPQSGAAPIACTNGVVSASQVLFDDAKLEGTNCQLRVTRSRIQLRGAQGFGGIGGSAFFENNLITQSLDIADTLTLQNMAPGSVFRFNTVVNTSGLRSDGIALLCSGAINVSSNIFAYGSMYPMGFSGGAQPPCPSRYSVFDTVAVPEHTRGPGNKVADSATFFASPAQRDFRPGLGSPARETGEADLGVAVDLDGKRRPQPVGAPPDAGCYEVP